MEEAAIGTQPPGRALMKRSTSPPPSSHGRTTACHLQSAAGPVSVKNDLASPPPTTSCPPPSAPGPRPSAPSLVIADSSENKHPDGGGGKTAQRKGKEAQLQLSDALLRESLQKIILSLNTVQSAAGKVSMKVTLASPPPTTSCPPPSAPGPRPPAPSLVIADLSENKHPDRGGGKTAQRKGKQRKGKEAQLQPSDTLLRESLHQKILHLLGLNMVVEPPASSPLRSTAPSLVKPPATPPQRAPAWREPSPPPSPAPPPTWLLLDRCVHRSKRHDGVFAGDPTTSDIAYDCVGREIRVSLRVADPPLVSRLYLHWTHIPVSLEMPPPYVIAAHRHSILFLVSVPFEDPCWWYKGGSFPMDYFVYSAASQSTSSETSSLTSLTRLPPVFEDLHVHSKLNDQDKALKPYLRQSQRYMSETDMAFFCHSHDGRQFTVANLRCFEEFELCVLHHSPACSSKMEWRIKKLPPLPEMGINPSSSWRSDTTFSIDGCFCWVDYYHGMLLVDVLLANSDTSLDQQQLRYIPLPKLALESSRPYTDYGAPDPFRHVCVTDEEAGIVKLVCIFTERSQPTFTIMTWSLNIHKGIWEDCSTIIRDSEFFGLFDAAQKQSKSKLPRVKPSFPVVSLADPDVICVLLKDNDGDRYNYPYWGIEINMREKVLQSTALYIREDEEEGYTPENYCWKFYGQYFVTSRFPCYLGQDDFESREISIKIEEEARQRLAMRKEALMECSKQGKANGTKAKQRKGKGSKGKGRKRN